MKPPGKFGHYFRILVKKVFQDLLICAQEQHLLKLRTSDTSYIVYMSTELIVLVIKDSSLTLKNGDY